MPSFYAAVKYKSHHSPYMMDLETSSVLSKETTPMHW